MNWAAASSSTRPLPWPTAPWLSGCPVERSPPRSTTPRRRPRSWPSPAAPAATGPPAATAPSPRPGTAPARSQSASCPEPARTQTRRSRGETPRLSAARGCTRSPKSTGVPTQLRLRGLRLGSLGAGVPEAVAGVEASASELGELGEQRVVDLGEVEAALALHPAA